MTIGFLVKTGLLWSDVISKLLINPIFSVIWWTLCSGIFILKFGLRGDLLVSIQWQWFQHKDWSVFRFLLTIWLSLIYQLTAWHIISLELLWRRLSPNIFYHILVAKWHNAPSVWTMNKIQNRQVYNIWKRLINNISYQQSRIYS